MDNALVNNYLCGGGGRIGVWAVIVVGKKRNQWDIRCDGPLILAGWLCRCIVEGCLLLAEAQGAPVVAGLAVHGGEAVEGSRLGEQGCVLFVEAAQYHESAGL